MSEDDAATNAAPVKYKTVCSAETTEASGTPTGVVDGAWYRHVTDRGNGCSSLSFARNRGTTDRRPSPSSTTPIDKTNLLALSTLIASRRPIFIWPMSKAVSVPGRPDAAQ